MLECSKQDLILSDGCEQYLFSYFSDLYNNRDANYANGRDVRNYFEKMMRARANRLSPILDTVSKDQVRTIILSDLENAKEMKNANW